MSTYTDERGIPYLTDADVERRKQAEREQAESQEAEHDAAVRAAHAANERERVKREAAQAESDRLLAAWQAEHDQLLAELSAASDDPLLVQIREATARQEIARQRVDEHEARRP